MPLEVVICISLKIDYICTIFADTIRVFCGVPQTFKLVALKLSALFRKIFSLFGFRLKISALRGAPPRKIRGYAAGGKSASC